MAHWPPISRDDLKQAAGSDGFDGVLPQLVRRLIAETADGLNELDMPGEGGVAIGGFDGVVTADRSTVEVPAGTSVWELSVNKGSGAKADSDYAKRLTGPEGRPAADVTYVQLILAPWRNASTWAAQRSKEGRWKKVRGLNLDAMRGWLDRAPATAVWLAERLGKAVPGARLADDWFDRTWLPSTRLPLSPAAVLAGREQAAAELLSCLAAGRSIVTVAGDLGADEFRAFVAAVADRADEPQRGALKARTLFVDDTAALARLTALPQPLVLVLADARLAASAPTGAPHQIVVLAPPGGDADVEVGPVDARALAELLAAAGEPTERADDLGALARRSLSALRRVLAVHPAALRPSWADGPDLVRRRLLLLGGWDGADPDDRALIERTTGRPWDEAQDIALALTGGSDTPMLGRLDDSWHVVSPSDAWLLLHTYMTRDDIDGLRANALDVLTEPDPLHGLGAAEALRAQMEGRRRRYSSALRHGLARSLALLGSTAGPVPTTGRTTGADQARLAVRDILAAANADPTYAVWAGLRPVLGDLAEAAPQEFLDAMREGVRGPDVLHARMFTDGDDHGVAGLLGPTASHSEFLWALETLAWSPEHFDEAVDILATLAELDPGGRYSNRPARSLADIFSCWHPTTAADEQQRELALRSLLRDHPQVTQALLVALIPDGHDTQVGHRGPRFRDWKRESVLTYADIERNIREVGELLMESLGEDPPALLAAIEKIDHLAREHRRALCDRLSALGESLANEADRAALSEALQSVAARHREYADAAWALPAEEIEPVEAAAAALAPRDPLYRHTWLFAQTWVETGNLVRRDDYEAYDRHVQQMRANAAAEVLTEKGLDGIEALASGTQWPHLVGAALADAAAPDVDADMLVWLELDTPRPDVAYAYLARRIAADPAAVDALLAASSRPRAKAAILRAAGDPPAAWARLEALGDDVAQAYWQRFSFYGLGDFQAVAQAAQGLMTVGRHAAVLALVSLYSEHVDSPDGAELVAAACEALLAADRPDPELRALSSHDLQTVVTLLHRHRDVLGRHRLVNIEWQLFPGLGFQADAPSLHDALSDDPSFFVEIVELVRPADQSAALSGTHSDATGTDDDGDCPTDATRAGEDSGPDDGLHDGDMNRASGDLDALTVRRKMAGRAFEVLQSWRRAPGAGPDGIVDVRRLDAWVDQARPLLAARGRLTSGDREIGIALAHSMPDPDGTTPPRAVRDLLERVGSDDIDHGLSRGIYNRRGPTSRGIFDGGDQERALAATFREHAAGAAAWPRTRRILRGLADEYEREARYNDEEAERRRRGLDS
jgi:hypothetical protein